MLILWGLLLFLLLVGVGTVATVGFFELRRVYRAWRNKPR